MKFAKLKISPKPPVNVAAEPPSGADSSESSYAVGSESSDIDTSKSHIRSKSEIIMDQRGGMLRSNETGSSRLIKELSNCHTCLLRSVCTKTKEFNNEQKNKGCQDIRTIYFQNFQKYTKPDVLLLRTLADLETQIQISTILDGKDNNVMSKERLDLIKLKKGFLEMVFKYGKGTVSHHVHEFKESDTDVIDMTSVSDADYD